MINSMRLRKVNKVKQPKLTLKDIPQVRAGRFLTSRAELSHDVQVGTSYKGKQAIKLKGKGNKHQ